MSHSNYIQLVRTGETMTRYVFNQVSLKGVKRWVDPVSGKKRQETRKFWQTVSPFNKNSKGEVKTSGEIMAELKRECDEWIAVPPAHEDEHAHNGSEPRG